MHFSSPYRDNNLMTPIEKLVVILPAYNEAQTLPTTIEAFAKTLPGAFVVVVDNDSSDGTADAARRALSDSGGRGLVLLEPRRGKGHAVRRGLKAVDADTVIICDADDTYPADAAPELLRILKENGADMVVGDRHSSGAYARENRRLLHGLGNRLVTWLVNSLFRAGLKDILSGYRVLSRRFVCNYPVLVDGFQLEADMTMHALDKRLTIVEVPVEYRDRPEGSFSKLSTMTDGARVLFVILQLARYYRPMLFFGSFAMFFFLMGLLAGVLPVMDYVQTRYVDHVPLAILATGLEILAVVTLAIALILDSIAHGSRLQFEKDL